MEYKNSFLNFKNEKKYFGGALVGNWLEDRVVPKKVDRKCISNTTEYKDMYRYNLDVVQISDNASTTASAVYKTRAKNMRSTVNLLTADQFIENMTTTNDVFYNIQTGKGATMRNPCRKPLASADPDDTIDALNSFGNYTVSGLRAYLKHQRMLADLILPDVSVTRSDYTCPRKGDYGIIKKHVECKTNITAQ